MRLRASCLNGTAHGLSFPLNSVIRILILPILYFIVLSTGCKEDKEIKPSGSLATYIQQSDHPAVNDLIACAANNLDSISGSEVDSVSIFFLPTAGATNFKYFETEFSDIDPHDHSLFSELELVDSPVFGGHLRKFTRTGTTTKKWCIVTFEQGDSLYYSNPIFIKSPELNTEFNTELLSIDQTEILSPIFNWQDGAIDESVIYFQVISDSNDRLISGTYTFEKTFQFYNLSNVTLNINDVTPPPSLSENEEYYFTLMAVSIDNWVNLIIRAPFDTKL